MLASKMSLGASLNISMLATSTYDNTISKAGQYWQSHNFSFIRLCEDIEGFHRIFNFIDPEGNCDRNCDALNIKRMIFLAGWRYGWWGGSVLLISAKCVAICFLTTTNHAPTSSCHVSLLCFAEFSYSKNLKVVCL